MDVSTITEIGSVTKLTGAVKNSKSVESDNTLPDVGQVSVRSQDQQDAGVNAPQAAVVSPAKPNSQELQGLVDVANETLQGRFSDLKFTVAEGTDISIVRIEDTETGELIRQVPSETMVAIARALSEAEQGIVLKDQA